MHSKVIAKLFNILPPLHIEHDYTIINYDII